jgi:hypothetical protein
MAAEARIQIDAGDAHGFQRQILDWYDVYRRDLPWRGDPDAYHILVSEVMLQQTQVDRVIPKYHELLERFPTLQSLAGASTADVLRAWQGLGYNRRAVNLKRAADWNQALMDYGALVHRAKPRRGAKREGRFETTNRYWRGRIIDALRAHALSLPALLESLPYEGREESRVRGLVLALHEEGLVEYDVSGDRVSLPE